MTGSIVEPPSATAMTEQDTIPMSKSISVDSKSATTQNVERISTEVSSEDLNMASSLSSNTTTTPSSPPLLYKSVSAPGGSYNDEWDSEQPLDKLTVLDLLGNLGVQQRLEQWQNTIAAHKQRVKRHQERLKSSSANAKQRAVEEVRKRLPTADEQLEKYRGRMKSSVDRLGSRWRDTATVTLREKLAFIAGVLNVFISGYLIGAQPSLFYLWFTGQLCYFMPLRYHIYHKKGYHYFLADLCYFVNLLTILAIWVFPRSKRVFISTYCLAYGNNAIAIAMWRNSMVFHSLDKVTSLFIHIMPPVTLHTIVHLTPPEILQVRFPAVHTIKFSPPDSPEHYDLWSMLLWATVPYAVWQVFYHLLINVRRRDKIAAGRPTSFTWMRRSYAKTWLGHLVLSLPDSCQELAFMVIQYLYAILTVIPCPLWFWYRWASAAFLLFVFGWSIYNGATYYIDVFGKRFQNELEELKRDVVKWQNNGAPSSPSSSSSSSSTTTTAEANVQSPPSTSPASSSPANAANADADDGVDTKGPNQQQITDTADEIPKVEEGNQEKEKRGDSIVVDQIPLLDDTTKVDMNEQYG